MLSQSTPSPATHDVLPSPPRETQIDQPATTEYTLPHGGVLNLDQSDLLNLNQPELLIPLRRSERQRHAPTRYGFD
jgi:hypothetical protein